MDSNYAPEEKYVRIDVTGKTDGLWQQLRPKLIQAIHDLMDTVVDPARGTTLQEEASKFSSLMLDHARARLERAGLENEKIEAEIHRLYTQTKIDQAEARKRHAEADAIEFETAMRKLRAALGLTKGMLIGEQGQEALLLGQQVDTFLEVLSDLTAM